jgi:phosphoglycolate phosphatase-like HAD superfamily hydrolase
MIDKKFTNFEETKVLLNELGDEFTIVKNPEYIFSPFEIYPLAKKNLNQLESIEAIVMDMDGTTTTTETLCIHSLEYMIRKMSGLTSKVDWSGLDDEDLPHIIGNSTTKHVEYLIHKYNSLLKKDKIINSFQEANAWTIRHGKDLKRREESNDTLASFNSSMKSNLLSNTLTVRMGIDIYYQRYHELLAQISSGNSSEVADELFNDPSKALIEPMPGVLTFLLCIKGLLNEELINSLTDKEFEREILKKLNNRFLSNPVKTAIVTSSIYYEANIVMNEVMHVLTKEIENMNISRDLKGKINITI